MAYSDFTPEGILESFGIENHFVQLFSVIDEQLPSEWLKTSLRHAQRLYLATEKGKSEAIVFPILMEVQTNNQDFLTIHSGENLLADKEAGLNGECDFILARDTRSLGINLPILQVVEAKRSEMEPGLSQCAAQLIGARLFNQKRNVALPALYGCVTNGRDWQFLKLETDISIDTKLYALDRLPELLGVFQHIVNQYKTWLT
jgi:hypothetical protein